MNGKIIEVHGGAAPSSRWCGAIVALVINLSLPRGPVPDDRTPGRLSKDREGMPTRRLCKRKEVANELRILKRGIPGRILITA
jgi:hypothetical protein